MFHVKSLVYLASREVYYHCYGIIENCSFYSHDYFLCHRYQGCIRGASAKKDYCCVCRTYEHYSLQELNDIKHNSFKLEKYYLNILRDLADILSIDPTPSFWKIQYCYWPCFTSSQETIDYLLHFNRRTCCIFKGNLDYLFSSKDIKWHLTGH